MQYPKSSFRHCLLLLLTILWYVPVRAQNLGCATRLSAEQEAWLRNFQQQLDKGTIPFYKNGLTYVPVQLHVVRKNDGTGGLRSELVLEALCKANRDFAPAGMYFYLANPINFINDDVLWRGEYEGVFNTAANEKRPGVVNIYFHGFSATWCGVYFPNPDVVLVQNSCANFGSTTLTHELGHFFSLPHTFRGWENGNVPPASQQERVDGVNCRNAGDGFCDTGPDYVSNRWGCPLTNQLTDPLGTPFRPDPDFYMNYASDACHRRFSNEQMLAMNANLTQRGIATSAVDTIATLPVVQLQPADGDSLINPASIRLVWQMVAGAKGYHVQVSRYQYWQDPHVNRIVNDTFLNVTLFGEWPFDWRVKPIMPGKTCGEFNGYTTFTTRPVPVGVVDGVDKIATWKLFPNPVKKGELLMIDAPEAEGITLTDITGKLVLQQSLLFEKSLNTNGLPEGIYFLTLYQSSHQKTLKLVIW
jgi:hypothetical protein